MCVFVIVIKSKPCSSCAAFNITRRRGSDGESESMCLYYNNHPSGKDVIITMNNKKKG